MLQTVCRSVYEITRDQIEQMFVLMRKHRGIGLAAPQVGIDARVFVTDWNQVFLNPIIVKRSVYLRVHVEGCLSLTTRHKVPRYEWVELATGEVFRGLKAQVIQHELNHLNGILINQWPVSN